MATSGSLRFVYSRILKTLAINIQLKPQVKILTRAVRKEYCVHCRYCKQDVYSHSIYKKSKFHMSKMSIHDAKEPKNRPNGRGATLITRNIRHNFYHKM